MNQILYTGGKNKHSGGSLTDIQKIVIFFVVFLIIFAICAIALGGNLLTKTKVGNISTNNEQSNTTPNTPVDSNIKVEFESQLGGVKTTVTCDKNIKTIAYWWDEEDATTVEVSDTKYEIVIPSKQGTHTLKIEVTDENEFTKTVSQLVIGDAGPELTILTDGVSNYVIRVKDDEQVDKIVVVLNGETQEIKVEAKEFEYMIAIPQGDSIIDVTAYNLNGLSVNKKAKITNFGG